ncbi:ABC transporter substrate-binding protein [Pseudactinotalea suaedae]|uniref:ABC transporter substrate-binding protein n=1 Tax=Pseudactinotalea suaedae TaxID=1524924 RepID=UPI0012E17347|nr:extracellular solute-binding protein [Pseudactinotalea suaedae]
MTQQIDRRQFLRTVQAGAIGAGLLGLAACGSGSGSGGATGGGGGTGGGGAARVRAAWWGGDVRHAKFNEIYDLYQAANEGVTIEREFADWSSYWERLPTQFAGGQAPDIIHVTERQVSDYASRDQLADLEALAGEGLIDLSHFTDSSIDAGRYDGRLVMLLIGATIPATMWNQAMFDAAGIEAPSVGWDWNGFYERCEAFRAALPDGQWGSTYQAVSTPTFDTFLIQNGKSIFAPDASPELNFEAADAEEWFAMWKELQDANLCQSAESASEQQSAPFEDTSFARSEAAMHVQNSNQLVTFQTAIGEENPLHLAPFPQMGAQPASLVIGSYVSINEGSESREECAKIVDFFVNDPEANTIFGLELGTPGNSNWAEAVEADLAEVDRRVLDFATEVESQSVFATPRPAGSARSETLMVELGLAVGFEQLTPAEAGTRLVDDLRAAITEAAAG